MRARVATRAPGARLVDGGFARDPGVMGTADRATGAAEKDRATAEGLGIDLDAGGDRPSSLRAFDHDHTHASLPMILEARRPAGSSAHSVRVLGGIAHL